MNVNARNLTMAFVLMFLAKMIIGATVTMMLFGVLSGEVFHSGPRPGWLTCLILYLLCYAMVALLSPSRDES